MSKKWSGPTLVFREKTKQINKPKTSLLWFVSGKVCMVWPTLACSNPNNVIIGS